MKYFETFAGVGGFGLGLQGECVGFSEVDKHASMVLKHNYSNIKNYGDITKIDWGNIPDFDLLVGGSPCQDFSVAGKRAGIAGKRSGLFIEYINALKKKKPKYFIWENVKGVLSSNGGWDFTRIQIEMAEAGYFLWWQVLNAKDFGVPQNRERVFVVGFRRKCPPEVFFEQRTNKEGVIANTIRTGGKGSLSKKHAWDLIQINKNVSQGYRVYDTAGLAVNIASQAGGLGAKTGLYAIPDRHGIYDGVSIRRLTPLECERLMSWPDNWTRWGINDKGEKVEISDSQRYKMCGNGVVSKVVEIIFKYLILDNHK